MTAKIDTKTFLPLPAKAAGGGRGTAFRESPSAATAAPIITALVASLAAVGGFEPGALVAEVVKATPPH